MVVATELPTAETFAIDLPGGDATAARRRFIGGPENLLALGAVHSFVASGDPGCELLVLHGPSGCGKSLLVEGIVQAMAGNGPTGAVVLATGPDFLHGRHVALERRQMDAWHARLDRAALLAIDGLDALAGRPAAGQELALALDRLLNRGGRAVFAARQTPHALRTLDPRLRSRLCAGLVVPVANPGPAARYVLLEHSASIRGCKLAGETLRFLAERLELTARGLAAVVAQLARDTDVADEATAARALVDRLASRQRVDLRRVAHETARRCGVALSELRGMSRRRSVVAARNLAMWLARQLTGHSLARIGAYFGGRDHTTVLHGCRMATAAVREDPLLAATAAALRQRLQRA
jgi:chromosomal replication initiator protein